MQLVGLIHDLFRDDFLNDVLKRDEADSTALNARSTAQQKEMSATGLAESECPRRM